MEDKYPKLRRDFNFLQRIFRTTPRTDPRYQPALENLVALFAKREYEDGEIHARVLSFFYLRLEVRRRHCGILQFEPR